MLYLKLLHLPFLLRPFRYYKLIWFYVCELRISGQLDPNEGLGLSPQLDLRQNPPMINFQFLVLWYVLQTGRARGKRAGKEEEAGEEEMREGERMLERREEGREEEEEEGKEITNESETPERGVVCSNRRRCDVITSEVERVYLSKAASTDV